jgi:folylpolyglutamate synthase/dihydropteroate synthase
MGLVYFKNSNVDVAILETFTGGKTDATIICNPKIAAITRVIDPKQELKARITDNSLLEHALAAVKQGTIAVSADQSKLNLQTMQQIVTDQGGEWAMPIRKVTALAYPFEQLHGRCAALAERIASIYVNNFAHENSIVVTDSLLAKTKGQRGRPTLETKRRSELHPKRTVEQFWKETLSSLPARFQLLDKEKPSLLLDNASNIDAFDNLLLGVRLLHYSRPLKGLTIILGCNNDSIDRTELLKMLRYFFKKTSGQIVVCPVNSLPGHDGNAAWDAESLTNDIKAMKVKATAAKDFAHAYQLATQTVDERDGLLIITGSSSIVSEYWKYKGIKKI